MIVAYALEIYQVIMTKIDLSACFLRNPIRDWESLARHYGPCAHCGDVLDGAWKRSMRVRYAMPLPQWGGYVEFCSPRCIAEHFRLHPNAGAAWSEKVLASPVEEVPLLTCDFCGHESKDRCFIPMCTPWESIWDMEDTPCFCSSGCVRAAFERDAAHQEERGRGKWFVPQGDKLPNGPLEEPHAAAHLKRLRRKLRPRELARLGY